MSFQSIVVRRDRKSRVVKILLLNLSFLFFISSNFEFWCHLKKREYRWLPGFQRMDLLHITPFHVFRSYEISHVAHFPSWWLWSTLQNFPSWWHCAGLDWTSCIVRLMGRREWISAVICTVWSTQDKSNVDFKHLNADALK